MNKNLTSIAPPVDIPTAMPVERRPVLFARYADLTGLRYDYPLVLVDEETDGPLLRPLSRLVDEALQATAAPGAPGEALRQQVLRLEGAVRRRVSRGERARLSELWRSCTDELLAASGEARFGPLDSNLDRAREALHVDGLVIDCDAATPKDVLVHVWTAVHRAKAKEFRKRIDGLILRLVDIIKADHFKSDEAHTSDALRKSVGESFGAEFDFGAFAAVLSHNRPEDRIPADRKARIQKVLTTLRSQRFYGPGRASERKPGQPQPHVYVFESCGAALVAFRKRLPELIDFVKALTIAELEIENKYRPERHDDVLASFDEGTLSREQLDLLPPALVCLHDGRSDSAETVRAFEAIASGLPIKVLIQTDDILGDATPEPSLSAFGSGSARLASMALGAMGSFVLQVSGAHLYRMRRSLAAGMRHAGPALFSVYSGASSAASHVAPYLLSAAATESRAFPTFSYDPSGGPNWASRFALDCNPRPTANWSRHGFTAEDRDLQRSGEEADFTFIDFAVADRRYARYFRPLEPDEATQQAPASECLSAPEGDRRVPLVPTIDTDDRLVIEVVDDILTERARRCLDAWNVLQEFAGINNSHANRLLATERQAAKLKTTATGATPQTAPEPVAATIPAAREAARTIEPAAAAKIVKQEAADAPAAPSTAPWIETSLCTTCNECTQINSRLFAYNENMQAYVADPDAGSYRQIVEAAESCQVSIIHPGQPRNPSEPDLEDLMERARPFNRGMKEVAREI